MVIDQILGWGLGIAGIVSMYLAGRKHWSGWLIGMLSEPVWIYYSVRLHQWGLIPASVAYGAVFGYNLWRWRITH